MRILRCAAFLIVLFALLCNPCAAGDANQSGATHPTAAKTILPATEDSGAVPTGAWADHAPTLVPGGTELGGLSGGSAARPAEGKCIAAPDRKLRSARQAVASVAHPVEAGALAQAQLYMMLRTKPATCDSSNPPTEVLTFATTDAQAVLWFLVTNAQVGDVFASSYYTPTGQYYSPASGPWGPATVAGSICLTDTPFLIAGATPASQPGLWSVKVTLNGQPLFTLRFTIFGGGSGGGTPDQVQSYMMLKTKPATCDSSNLPTAVTTFLTTDTQAVLWFLVNNVAVGDVFASEYYTPSGQFYSPTSGPWGPSSTAGSTCLNDAPFLIAGAAPASQPGIWTVKVKVNGQLLFTLPFTIAGPTPCTYSISGGSSAVSGSGGNVTLNVSAGSGCPWTASSNASWITIQSGASGSGNGTVALNVGVNTSSSSRSGTATIAGQTVTIQQAAGSTPTPAPTVPSYMMTLALPSTCSLSNQPTAATVFAPTVPQAYLWFYVSNGAVGDVLSSEYYTPSGQLYGAPGGSWNAASTAGDHCFPDSPFQIAGAAPATMPGVWTVKVRLNGQLVFTLSFTISPQTLPTITAVAGGGGSVPPVKEISPGGYVMISGANFAPAGTARQVQPGDIVNGMLPTQLAGVCVDVSGQSAYITFVASDRIYFQVPNTTAQSSASIRVRTNCGTTNEQVSNVKTAWCQGSSPELLYWAQNSDGTGPVAAVNATTGALVGLPDLVPGIAFSPARPGDILTIYGVSFGATNPSYSPGEVPNGQGTVTGNPAVSLGTVGLDPLNIVYAGVSPGTAGLYQLNIRIPNLPDGTYPLTFGMGIYVTPSNGYLTIKN